MKLKKSKKESNVVFSEETSQKYTNIRDIVDYSRPFNIFYSGVEDENNLNILYDMGIRNFLMSYHYIQNKHLDINKYKEMGIKFFIDSGAYTYQMDSKYWDIGVEEWEKIIKRYLNWAKKHRDVIFAIANLDLENLLGEDIIKEWNEKYFEPFMLETGIPVCYIWHPISTDLGWERYCQRYPYVGMSWVSEDSGSDLSYEYGVNLLRVAEKYNTVVHGMGMTRTALLTKLSFYTSDSTTWLVGLQYGEINFWNNNKMSRLKKDKWKGQYLDVICNKFGLNPELLLQEDNTEMIKANVGAFIEAENFIQHMAKSRFYWQKAKAKKRTKEDLKSLEYPSPEWLRLGHGKRDNIEKYADEFNISKENLFETENLIVDVTCFMNWDNPSYADFIQETYTPEVLKEIHDVYVNKIVENDEQRIQDLKDFYTANLLGESTVLLYLGTNFDRIVKERDEYVTDEEYELVDVPEMEIQNKFHKYLPAPKESDIAPEISSLDDEIFDMEGIVPVRDSKGKFLKGQKKVLKPKKLYSEKYPKMACDMCVNAQKCPEFRAGYACAYNKMFQRYDTRDLGDIIQAMQGIVDLSMQRLQRGMLSEILNGGIPDPNVSGMMNQSMGLLSQLQRVYEAGSTEVLRQTKIVRSDGTEETTTTLNNPQSGGILAKIFGGMGEEPKEREPERNMIDTKAEDKE